MKCAKIMTKNSSIMRKTQFNWNKKIKSLGMNSSLWSLERLKLKETSRSCRMRKSKTELRCQIWTTYLKMRWIREGNKNIIIRSWQMKITIWNNFNLLLTKKLDRLNQELLFSRFNPRKRSAKCQEELRINLYQSLQIGLRLLITRHHLNHLPLTR